MSKIFITGNISVVSLVEVTAFIYTIIGGSHGITCKLKDVPDELCLANDFKNSNEAREWLIRQLMNAKALDD